MGMFDHIKCDYPLPGSEPPNKEFQTKDMSCQLDEYTITAGGRLVMTKKWNAMPDDDDWMAVIDMQYNGQLDFYTNGEDGEWWEYTACFKQGQLQRIARTSPKVELEDDGAITGF